MLELMLATALVFVVDGDTIQYNNENYRLVGYDTPELYSGKCRSERSLASRARLRLLELTKHPTARMQEVLCYGSNFGRKCAIVTVNGRNVGEYLQRERMADPYWCGSSGCPKRRDWCVYDRR